MKVSHGQALCCCLLFLVTGCGVFPSGGNRAQDELNAILPALNGVHPTKLCQVGYGDKGIDSQNSLSDVWLAVDATPGLDDTARSAAAAGKFTLATDQEVIDDLKHGAPNNWIGFRAPAPGERYQSTSTYLTSPAPETPYPAEHPHGERLRLVVTRTGPVQPMCGPDLTPAAPYTVPRGRAVLELYLTTED